LVCERPLEIHRELVDADRPRGWNSHRLHCEDGPAVSWPDGWGVWSIHGVPVTKQIVETPESLTVAQIRDEPNSEIKRIMLERFGAERFMTEAGGSMVREDDWGRLWTLPSAPDEPDGKPLVMVEMQNATVEPDGRVRTFYERVPPHIKTPVAGLAWQADMKVGEYKQLAQQT